MKKSYKRLFAFQLITIILFFLSSFVPSILGEYFKVLILIVLLALFKVLFGFEKDRNRFIKEICAELLICLLIYFLIYYLSGILFTFARTLNYWNYNGIINVIMPMLITIFAREILRYMMVKKSEGSELLLISSCLFFIAFDLLGTFSNKTFSSPYKIFIYIAITVLPIISRNIFTTYLSYKVGYKPAILYYLVIDMYIFLVPIIPNPNEYIYSVIELIVPMIFMYRIYKFYKREKDEKIDREYNKKRIGRLILPTLIIMFLVYITSGYFYYYAIVIASGSMTPNILKGDVVVIEKINDKSDIEIGQVIAYKYDNIVVVHRIVKKINVQGEMIYYTKGDANNDIDNCKISEDMIIGIVNIRVPYIGYPTVWIKEL